MPIAGSGVATWSYDVLDNIRTHATTPVSGPTWSRAYQYDVSNRLTSITQDGAPWGHYTYDPRGNMIDKTGQTLVFDRANRLTQIPNVASYEYDGHGRRTSQWRADGTVRVSLYTLDGRLQGEADNRAVGSTDYMYLGSTLVAKRFQHWSGSPPVVTYQHSDGLGSPVLETDTNGAVVSRERFLSYGGAVDGAVNDTIGYTGHQEDPASGLVYMQQRYYDPAVGRFLSIDPVSADYATGVNFNRYLYGDNSPYAFVDPDGRAVVSAEEGRRIYASRKDKGHHWVPFKSVADIDVSDAARRVFGRAVSGIKIDAKTHNEGHGKYNRAVTTLLFEYADANDIDLSRMTTAQAADFVSTVRASPQGDIRSLVTRVETYNKTYKVWGKIAPALAFFGYIQLADEQMTPHRTDCKMEATCAAVEHNDPAIK